MDVITYGIRRCLNYRMRRLIRKVRNSGEVVGMYGRIFTWLNSWIWIALRVRNFRMNDLCDCRLCDLFMMILL